MDEREKFRETILKHVDNFIKRNYENRVINFQITNDWEEFDYETNSKPRLLSEKIEITLGSYK